MVNGSGNIMQSEIPVRPNNTLDYFGKKTGIGEITILWAGFLSGTENFPLWHWI